MASSDGAPLFIVPPKKGEVKEKRFFKTRREARALKKDLTAHHYDTVTHPNYRPITTYVEDYPPRPLAVREKADVDSQADHIKLDHAGYPTTFPKTSLLHSTFGHKNLDEVKDIKAAGAGAGDRDPKKSLYAHSTEIGWSSKLTPPYVSTCHDGLHPPPKDAKPAKPVGTREQLRQTNFILGSDNRPNRHVNYPPHHPQEYKVPSRWSGQKLELLNSGLNFGDADDGAKTTTFTSAYVPMDPDPNEAPKNPLAKEVHLDFCTGKRGDEAMISDLHDNFKGLPGEPAVLSIEQMKDLRKQHFSYGSKELQAGDIYQTTNKNDLTYTPMPKPGIVKPSTQSISEHVFGSQSGKPKYETMMKTDFPEHPYAKASMNEDVKNEIRGSHIPFSHDSKRTLSTTMRDAFQEREREDVLGNDVSQWIRKTNITLGDEVDSTGKTRSSLVEDFPDHSKNKNVSQLTLDKEALRKQKLSIQRNNFTFKHGDEEPNNLKYVSMKSDDFEYRYGPPAKPVGTREQLRAANFKYSWRADVEKFADETEYKEHFIEHPDDE